MNKIMVGLLAVVMGASSAWAEDTEVSADQVPEAVMSTVKSICPDGTVSEIELEDEDGQKIYEVELMVGEKSCDLKIAADGTALEVEREITLEELPKKVRKTVDLFSNATVTMVEKVQDQKKNITVYEVEMEMGEQVFELVLSPKGMILEQEFDDEGDHGDDDDKDRDHDDDDDDDDDD